MEPSRLESARADQPGIAATRRSTPAVGSSRKKRSGSPASARAISTRCCWPPGEGGRCHHAHARTGRLRRSLRRSARRSSVPEGRNGLRRESRPEETTSHTDAGTPPDGVRALRNESDPAPVVELAQRRTEERHASTAEWSQTGEGTHERRLSGAVGAQQCNELACRHRDALIWRRIGRPSMATLPSRISATAFPACARGWLTTVGLT